MEWHIIGVLAFVVIYNIWRYYHEDDSHEYSPVGTDATDTKHVAVTNMEDTISTRQLALNTIEHNVLVIRGTDKRNNTVHVINTRMDILTFRFPEECTIAPGKRTVSCTS